MVKGGDEANRGACGDNVDIGEGGDKSGLVDGHGELGESGICQCISDWGWAAESRERGWRWQQG